MMGSRTVFGFILSIVLLVPGMVVSGDDPATTTVDFSTLSKSPPAPVAPQPSSPPVSSPTPQAVPAPAPTPKKRRSVQKTATPAPEKVAAEPVAAPAPLPPSVVLDLSLTSSDPKVHVGDTERDVRNALGNPAIETSTENKGEKLWIYTRVETVNGVECRVIQWKVIFQDMRLKDWVQPKGIQYFGNCAR